MTPKENGVHLLATKNAAGSPAPASSRLTPDDISIQWTSVGGVVSGGLEKKAVGWSPKYLLGWTSHWVSCCILSKILKAPLVLKNHPLYETPKMIFPKQW